MHRPCLFRRQNTNTHTNRCLPPLASTMAETLQLETAYNRDYPSRSAQIQKADACNKQGTKARWHLAMQNENMSQGEEGVHNRMAGGGAGQHTTQANETLPIAGATSPSGHNTWTHAHRDATSSRSYRRGPNEMQTLYRATGNGRSIVGNHTSTSGTPAAAATETTKLSRGSRRTERDWP